MSRIEVNAATEAPSVIELWDNCINDGVTLFTLSEEYRPEADALVARLSDSEENYAIEVVSHLAPNMMNGLVLPLSRLVKANATTVGLIRQPRRIKSQTSLLHVDGVISSGMSVLIPVSGPEADLYYSENPAIFPDPELPRVVYGVGKAVLLRQSLRIAASGHHPIRYLDAINHGGWCETGDRRILSIDLHNFRSPV